MLLVTQSDTCVITQVDACDVTLCRLQVSTKLSTFSPRELAGVLVALGQLGYEPSPEWFAQVRAAETCVASQ